MCLRVCGKFGLDWMTLEEQMVFRPCVRSWVGMWQGCLCLALLFVGLGMVPLQAQVVTATLSGTVEDSMGAVIPGATVQLKNNKNGFVRKATTDGSGLFAFVAVDFGDYTLTVKATGFEKIEQKGIHLDPGDVRTLSAVKMKPGSGNVTVHVTTRRSSLDTGERSDLITAGDLEHLTTIGRDVTELLKILPGSAIATGNGAIGQNSAASNTTYDPGQVTVGGGSGSYSMSGAPTNGVSVRSDGVNLDDPGSYNATTQNVNMEATAEVKVQQSNFGADVANGPVVINAVGKTGGSDYHGSVYVSGRAYLMNSTDALAKVTGAGKIPDRYIYPGVTFSGPVKIPGTDFNHQKKLVFFLQGEDYIQRNVYAYNSPGSGIVHALVPTPAMRKGDFSPTQIAAYLPPGVAVCDNSCIQANETIQYANINTVPTSDINGNPANCTSDSSSCLSQTLDAGAMALINALMPEPNTPGGLTTAGGYNYVSNALVNNDMWQAHGRLDYANSDRNKFYGIYTVERGVTSVPQADYYIGSGNSGAAVAPNGGSAEKTNSESGSFNWTRVFSNTITNEAYADLAYLNQTFYAKSQSGLESSTIGYPYLNAYNNGSKQFPTLVDYGYDGLPLALIPDYSFGGIYAHKYTPGFGDNLTKVWGKHEIKIGVNVERPQNNEFQANSGGVPSNGGIENYYVSPTFTLPVSPGSSSQITLHNSCYNPNQYCGTGNNLANFIQGELFQYNQANFPAKVDTYWWSTAFYGSDDWKVLPNLTLTIGLRVEHQGEWQDAHHVGIPIFKPSLYSGTPTAADPLPGFTWHAMDKSVPISGTTDTMFFLDPRAGFSWDIRGNGKTILSGGYGWYRYHDNWNDVVNAVAISEGQRTLALLNPIGVDQGLTLNYIGTLALPTNSNLGALGTTGLNALDPTDHKQPITQTYSLTLSRQLWNSTFAVGYVGNNSNSILNDGSNESISLDNVNAIKPGGLFTPDPNPNSTFYQTTYTPEELTGMGETPSSTLPSINDWRPYPIYGSLQLEAHTLFANYNGLQVTWNKTMGWFTFNANYTWSKALGVRGGFNNGIPGDTFNVWNDYGPLSSDRSNIFNLSYYVNLGSHVHGNRILGALANQWAISGYTMYQSGPNIQATDFATNVAMSGSLTDTALNQYVSVTNQDFLGTPDVSLQPLVTCNPAAHFHSHLYVNGSCFQLPQIGGANGPLLFPYMHGPAYFDSDLTLIKDVALGGPKSFELRAAAFNFLNHPNVTFSNLDPTEEALDFINGKNLNSSQAVQVDTNFGTTDYKVGRRIVEIALKFTY